MCAAAATATTRDTTLKPAGRDILELLAFGQATRDYLQSAADRTRLPRKFHRAWELCKGSEFKLVRRDRGFVRDGIRLNGLTEMLNTLYHQTALNCSTGGASTGGSVRGVMVDNQLTRLIDRQESPEVVDGFTCNVLRAMQKKQLYPFMTQANVGSCEWKVGTALDILCISMTAPDEYNNVVAVQLKTFGPRNHHKPDGKFSPLFRPCEAISSMNDTLIQRALLQVTCEYAITQAHHNNPLFSACLLVVTGRDCYAPLDGQVAWYPMPQNYLAIGRVFGEHCRKLQTLSEHEVGHKKQDCILNKVWAKRKFK